MFSGMGAFVKVSSDYGATLSHVILFLGVPSVLLLYFWTHYTHRSLVPTSWKLHFWRNVSGITSMWLGFFAISHLPLPTAISLNYTAPLFIAGWMLGWGGTQRRSEEHTSELQSLMRISYAVFCVKKKKSKYAQKQEQNSNNRQNYKV